MALPGQSYAEQDESLKKLGKQIVEQYDGSTLHQRKSINQEIARIANVRREHIDDYGQEGNTHQEDSQLDTTVRESANILLNGKLGRLTPPSSQWFGARQEDSHTDANTKALEQAMRRIFNDITGSNSNFYEMWSETALDGIHFGNMCCRILRGKRRKFNFTSIPNGHYVFLVDDEGFTDTVLRKYKMTADAMEKFFGRAGLPQQVTKELDSHTKTNRETKFEIVHRVRRRDELEPEEGFSPLEPDPEKREFESIYVLKDSYNIVLGQEQENGNVIYKDGLYENAYVVERLFTVAGNTSGEGITSQILPKCREIQHSKMQLNQAKDQIAKRSWWDPGSGLEEDPNVPGQLIQYDPVFPNSKPEPIPSDANAAAVIGTDLSDLRTGIQEAYSVPFFRFLTNADVAGTAKTAFETQAIKAEQLALTIAQVKSDVKFLSHVIEILFAIKLREGEFNDLVDNFPESYEVEITSPLAKALEGSTQEAFFNTVQFVLGVDPVMPWLKHSFDSQAQFTDILIDSPLNTKYVRTKKEANDAYEREMQMQQAMQMAQVANLGADAAVKMDQAGQG